MLSTNLPRYFESKNLRLYAFPGGYPIFYLSKGGEVLCPGCAQDAETNYVEAAENERSMYEDDLPVAAAINWTTPHCDCEVCGANIEPAYE